MQKGIINQVEEIAKEGKKTFYRVKLQDGAEMSTFDSKIKQAESGDGLEFDVTISGKYINLKDGFIITKSASIVDQHTAHSKENGYPDMSKEEWAEKQKIERDSIEAQVAVKCVFGLREYLINANVDPAEDFAKVFNKAMVWCEARIDASMKAPVKASAKAIPKAISTPINPEDVEFDGSPVQSLGDLWTRCKNYNISKSDGLQLLGIGSQEEVIDLDEAWRAIFNRNFNKEEPVSAQGIEEPAVTEKPSEPLF